MHPSGNPTTDERCAARPSNRVIRFPCSACKRSRSRSHHSFTPHPPKRRIKDEHHEKSHPNYPAVGLADDVDVESGVFAQQFGHFGQRGILLGCHALTALRHKQRARYCRRRWFLRAGGFELERVRLGREPPGRIGHALNAPEAGSNSISTGDAAGVVLAAIQGLDQKLISENAELREELAVIKVQADQMHQLVERDAELERRLGAMEERERETDGLRERLAALESHLLDNLPTITEARGSKLRRMAPDHGRGSKTGTRSELGWDPSPGMLQEDATESPLQRMAGTAKICPDIQSQCAHARQPAHRTCQPPCWTGQARAFPDRAVSAASLRRG